MEEEGSANPGGEGGERLEGERHAGHQPSSPLQLPPRISRNPQGKNSIPKVALAAHSIPGPLGGPFTKHPSVQAPTSCPAPARRGALVRQGGGRPTAPQGGDRGPVSEQAPPTPPQGRHGGPLGAAARPPCLPGGCVPEVGGRGRLRVSPGPRPGPPPERAPNGRLRRESAGRRAVSSERSRRRGLGDRCPPSCSRSSPSRSSPSLSLPLPSPRRLATAAAPAGGAAVIPAPEEPALPVPGAGARGKPGRGGGPNR